MANDRGMTMTKKFEGFRSNPYKDTMGIPTVGYGFNIHANRLPNAPMTMEQANALFLPIYQEAIKRAQRFAGPSYSSLSPIRQDVLNDMAYNLGERLFNFKKLKSNISSGDMQGAAKEMVNSNWFKQTGRRAPALVDMWLGKRDDYV